MVYVIQGLIKRFFVSTVRVILNGQYYRIEQDQCDYEWVENVVFDNEEYKFPEGCLMVKKVERSCIAYNNFPGILECIFFLGFRWFFLFNVRFQAFIMIKFQISRFIDWHTKLTLSFLTLKDEDSLFIIYRFISFYNWFRFEFRFWISFRPLLRRYMSNCRLLSLCHEHLFVFLSRLIEPFFFSLIWPPRFRFLILGVWAWWENIWVGGWVTMFF